MLYPFYIILGFLPSIIWLLFYLRQDKHPEPNSMVIRVFIWGMLLAPLAILLEVGLIWLTNPTVNPFRILSLGGSDNLLRIFLIAALIPALVEEYLKYSIVKLKVLKSPQFDEPLDAMLYCIIAALGFAAVENLLILFQSPLIPLGQALQVISFRFLGATFIHALASAIVGYYLALGLLHSAQRGKLIIQGLLLAIIFHTSYNCLIITASQINKIAILPVILILILMAVLVSYQFSRLKKELSVCKT